MGLVYVTGISGAGKSAACAELRRRGYLAYDTDDPDMAVWVDRTTGEIVHDRGGPGFLADHEWRVVRSKVETLAARADARLTFLCGSTANENEVWHLFARVVCLVVDAKTLEDRVRSRTTNDFGKAPHERDAILAWRPEVEMLHRTRGSTLVDGTRPLHEVVDRILAASI